MSTDSQIEEIYHFDDPILQFPGLKISEPRQSIPRTITQTIPDDIPKIKQKKSAKSSKSVKPQFDNKLFPLWLSGILLKPEPPVNVKLPQHNYRYLGVLCLKNKKTNDRIFHMFPTCDRNIGRDYDNARAVYENKPDIINWNNVTTEAICPETLRRSAVAHFSNYKWNKDRNILTVPSGEMDEWSLSNKLQEFRVQQVRNLFNYIHFLKMSKS